MVSELNYHTRKVFSIEQEMKKQNIFINNLVCLGLSILEINKIAMHQFCNDYVRPKCNLKQNYIIWVHIVSFFM